MTLPNFIIVGAMKAGTTTLANMLSEHPQIFIPNNEVHYFNRDEHFLQGINWYQKQFQEASQETVIGEKTPTYSYLPKVPERIYQEFPTIKLIWLFREPVSRTYSNYWHAVRARKEHLSFEQAIEKESERIKSNLMYGYVKRSIYVEQVKRYLEFFPKENMHFIVMEELLSNPRSVLEKSLLFLDVDTDKEIPLSHQNKTSSSSQIQIDRFPWITKKLHHYFPKSDWLFLHKLNSKLNAKSITPHPIKPETQKQLKEHFKPFNNELSAIIEKDLSIWNT